MRLVLLAAALLAGCGGDSTPLFPADYASTYVQVRPCRPSGDHDLNNVRILADATAAGPYMSRTADFPVGAVVLKEEHDFGDTDCTGPTKQFTVMAKQPINSAPKTLDWKWQQVDAKRNVVHEDEPRCYGCHTTCGVPPDGYQGTCSAP